MKINYTEQHMSTFFDGFKTLKNPYHIEQVHLLLNNPNAKATHRVNLQTKHLKFIIMTSAFIIGVASILFYLQPKEHNKIDTFQNTNIIQQESPVQNNKETNFNTVNNSAAIKIKEKTIKNNNKVNSSSELIPETVEVKDSVEMTGNNEKGQCIWPKDTLIDKYSLYVYLSNEELEHIGIRILDPSGSEYYIKTPSNSHYNNVNHDSVSDEFTSPFSLRGITDTLCSTYRWGHYFYDEVDKLIPIRPTEFDNHNLIFWFDPYRCMLDDEHGDSIFKALPPMYRHLKEIFDQIKCHKLKYPEKRLVNHIDENRNIVLDKINWLTLNKTEFENLGVIFERNKIELNDSLGIFSFVCDSNKVLTKNASLNAAIIQDLDTIFTLVPTKFPVMITDIKGLTLYKFGANNVNSGSDIKNYNYLIPVYFPLSTYVKNKDYDLVFWYEPTDAFISTLPKKYRDNLILELEENTKPENGMKSSCNFYEACKSTLEMDNFKLYPNPAKNAVSIEFIINEKAEGSISIVNIAGARLKTLIPNATFPSGHNTYQMDLSGINPGIYLISINTDKGFRTQRLIVSQ